jgi:hypothetical protein
MGGLWAGGLLPLCERRGDDAAVTMWFFWFKFISSCLRLMENCIDSLVAGSFFFSVCSSSLEWGSDFSLMAFLSAFSLMHFSAGFTGLGSVLSCSKRCLCVFALSRFYHLLAVGCLFWEYGARVG